MLRMNMNLIGFALVATLFAGCQTASKSNTVTEFERTYGPNADLDEVFAGYGLDRRPASAVEGIIKEVYNSLHGIKIAAVKGAEKKEATKDFLDMVNRLKSEEVKNLREAKLESLRRDGKKAVKGVDDRLNAKDLEGLSVRTQTELAASYLHSRGLQDLKSLNSIRERVDAQLSRIATDDREFKDTRNVTTLLTEGTRKDMSAVNAVNKNAALKNELDKAYKRLDGLKDDKAINAERARIVSLKAEIDAADKIPGNADRSLQLRHDLTNSLDNLTALLKQKAANPNEAAEIELLVKETRIRAGEIWQLTGDSHLIPETCENFDKDSLRKYSELLGNIRDELAKNSSKDSKGRWTRVKCDNVDRITAWVTAKLQQSLGRTGLLAWNAVEEMTFCKYIKDSAGKAARTLATETPESGKVGDIPANMNCRY